MLRYKLNSLMCGNKHQCTTRRNFHTSRKKWTVISRFISFYCLQIALRNLTQLEKQVLYYNSNYLIFIIKKWFSSFVVTKMFDLSFTSFMRCGRFRLVKAVACFNGTRPNEHDYSTSPTYLYWRILLLIWCFKRERENTRNRYERGSRKRMSIGDSATCSYKRLR